LSRSRATGNLQATLNGTFFWEILILSRSLATGKLQATLKLIFYFCLSRFFFFESSIAQFAISTLFSVPFGFNFVYIGSFDSTPWYFWGRHSTLENIENIPQIIILFKNRNVVLFICFAIARSAYLRLRPGSAYLRLRWLGRNQHSAAFSPLGVRWSAFDSTPWYFWGRHLILFPIGIPGVGV